MSALSFAADSALPSKPQAQSEASQSVQSKVDKQTAEEAAEKRKKLVADATAALAETHKALRALESKKNEAALKALAEVTGKLDLIVARDPKLAQVPVETEVVTYDLLTDLDTIKKVIKEAKAYLNDGEIQKARPLVANLASEIQYRTLHLPLATYPSAIKAIAPLIDAGKIDEAKAGLQAVLNTLVVTTDDVVPLPKLRAEHLLKQAQELAEKKDRSKEENDKLAKHLQASREQLQMAELLGYGKKEDVNPLYEQISEIEKKSAGGKSGTGWFDKIKQQLSNLF
jgi:DNA polymerase/3'-5' exonuclease PolX